MHVGIGRQRVSDEAEWLRGRIGKEGPPCPRLLLAEVQTDPREGDFPDADFRIRMLSGYPVIQAQSTRPLEVRTDFGGNPANNA